MSRIANENNQHRGRVSEVTNNLGKNGGKTQPKPKPKGG
jgi:hypothetical protein